MDQGQLSPHICWVDTHYCVATWDRVLIQIWRLEVTAEAVQNLRRIGKQFVAETSGPLSMLSIVEASSPPPNEPLRAALSAFFRELAPRMELQIVVAEGSGFRAALVRSVGVALSAIARGALPFKFCGHVADAAALIRPHLSPSAGGAEALLGAIHDVRAKIP